MKDITTPWDSNPYLQKTFLNVVSWALAIPEVVELFRRETGSTCEAITSNQESFQAFIDWLSGSFCQGWPVLAETRS